MSEVSGWESLRAAEAIARLPRLSDAQLDWVEGREAGPRGRVTVRRAVEETRATRRQRAEQRARRPAGSRARLDPRAIKDV